MEVTGLTVGIAGLASLFGACIDAIERVDSYRNFGFESRHITAQFNADKVLLNRWATSVGVSAGGVAQTHHPALDREEIASAIARILSSIREIFFMTGSATSESQIFDPPESSSFSLADPFKPTKDMSVISKKSHPLGLRGEKLGWTLGGKAKFVARVEAFDALVGKLYSLVPPPNVANDTVAGFLQHEGITELSRGNSWFVETHRNLQEILSRVRDDARKEVKHWLRAIITDELYEKRASDHLSGTCHWILEKSFYRNWISPLLPSQPSRILWIYGLAGYGKSVLCASIVKQLRENSDFLLAHFFCSSETDNLLRIVQSWIWQAAALHSNAFSLAQDRMRATESQFATPGDTWELFEEIFRALPNYTLVADGLDECLRSDRDGQPSEISAFFLKLKKSLPQASVRVLFVSREDSAIRGGLYAAKSTPLEPTVSLYEITKRDLQADINSFSTHVINERLHKQKQELKEEFANKMAEKCDGMFLWIELQRESLRATMSKKQLQETIDDMPKGLNRTYDQYWDAIDQLSDREKSRALSILRWVTFSLRPLTVFELTECLVIQDNDACDELQTDDFPEIIDEDYINDEILGLCGPLLEIRSAEYEQPSGQKFVRLSHFSIEQYLISKFSAMNPLSTPDFEHNILAKLCLRYLGYGHIWTRSTSSESELENHPFLDYAVKLWILHTRQVGHNFADVIGLINQFFTEGNKKWLYWRDKYSSLDGSESAQTQGASIEPGGLAYYASLFNLLETLKHLWANVPREWDKLGGRYGTALQAACAKGHQSIVSFLIHSGADLDEEGGEFGCAINAAIAIGDCKLTQILLDSGASVWKTDPAQRSSVYLASKHGYLEIASMLLAKGAEFVLPRCNDWTPVNVAANGGHTETVKLLLEKGADFSIPNNVGMTPLYSAANGGHLKIVELLLEKGADFALTRDNGWTPINAAANGGHTETVKLLLEKGADFSIPNNDGMTPLYSAANGGHSKIVELLLEKGADFALARDNGWTPINAAANGGHTETVKLLLEKGADFSIPNNVGMTPLYSAANGGHSKIVKLLLEKGANFALTRDNGWTPINAAANGGHTETVKLLLEKGADFSIPNNSGMTPLYTAARNGHVETVKVLTENGADLSSALSDGLKTTPLTIALINGHDKVARLLLECGAELTQLGGGRYSALHCIAYSGCTGMIRPLINAGVYPEAENSEETSVLLFAAELGKYEFVRELMNTGKVSDIGRVDLRQRSALHYAAEKGFVDIVRLLLDRGIRNTRDNDQNFPIHLAALHGHDQVVNELIEMQDKDAQGYYGQTILGIAAVRGHAMVANTLLEKKVNLELSDNAGCSPLFRAIQANHIEIAELLINKGANLNSCDGYSYSISHVAARGGHVGLLRKLIEMGCDVKARDRFGRTVFFEAVCSKNPDIVDLLLGSGINGSNDALVNGATCVMVAAENGDVRLVTRLKSAGADLTVADAMGRTIQERASYSGRHLLLDHLSTIGIPPNDERSPYTSPLFAASESGHVRCVEILLSNNAKVDFCSVHSNMTPLQIAAAARRPQIVRKLVAAGASTQCRDAFGNSALDYASQHLPTLQAMGDGTAASVDTSLTSTEKYDHLCTTIRKCLGTLLQSSAHDKPSEQIVRLLTMKVLGLCLIYIRDDQNYENAKLVFMELVFPPSIQHFRCDFLCRLCHKQCYSEIHVCVECFETWLCPGCYSDYVDAGRRSPKAIADLEKLEASLESFKNTIFPGIDIQSDPSLESSLPTLDYSTEWLDSKIKEYDAWEKSFNLEDKFASRKRSGQEILKLVEESRSLLKDSTEDLTFQGCDISKTSLTSLRYKFAKYRMENDIEKDFDDFSCLRHDYIKVSRAEHEKLTSKNDIFHASGCIRGEWLRELLEKYTEREDPNL